MLAAVVNRDLQPGESPLHRAQEPGSELEGWRAEITHPERLEAVRKLGLLGTAPEPEFDRLTRVARRMLGGSIALLSAIDDQRQFNKSVDASGSPVMADNPEALRDVPIEGSFCRHVVAKQSAILVPDTSKHDVLRSMLGANPMGIHSYAGVPLVGTDEHVVGVLCVMGDRPRQFTDEDLQALEDLASIAADEIALRAANERVEAQRRLLAAVVDKIEEPVIVVEVGGRVLLRNPAYDAFFGQGAAALQRVDPEGIGQRGYRHSDGVTPIDFQSSPLGRVFAGENPVRMGIVYRPPGATADRHFRANATALHKPDGTVGAGIVVLHDVTEERKRERAHEERRVLLDVVLGTLPDTSVFVFDPKLNFLVASGEAVMKRIGVSSDAVGKHVSQVVTPRHAIALGAAFERTLEGGSVQQRITREGRALDAQTIPLRSKTGEVFAGLALVTDVTERVETERLLMAQARELEALSLTDELTGLNNRRGFVTLATQQLKVATRNLRHAAVIYLDVNDLKPVNDKLGHEEGDRLLRDVARVLRDSFRESDVMARLGGDEFAVLTVDITPQNAAMLEERVVRAERAFNQREERPYLMSLSIGTELFDPGLPSSLEELLARADERMYARKVARKKDRVAVG